MTQLLSSHPQPCSPSSPGFKVLKNFNVYVFDSIWLNHHLRQIKGDVLNVLDVPQSPTWTHHVLLDGLPELEPGLPLWQNPIKITFHLHITWDLTLHLCVVPEISALCFRGICSCSLPPASVQWRCSCWAVSAWCSPCSAGSWCLLGVQTTLSLHISLSKPWTATFWDVHPAHTTTVVPQQHDQCKSEQPRQHRRWSCNKM